MWEEPRPERLRRIDNDRKRQFRQSVIAYSIIFGAIGILWKAAMIDRTARDEAEQPMAPPQQPHSSPVTPESVLTRPRTNGPGRTDPGAQPRPPRQPLTNTARGDPTVMRTLVETCTYWTQQNTQGQYAGNQEMACRDMAAYAREHGFSVPQVSVRMPGTATGAASGITGAGPQVYVNQCTTHTYGSVSYRQCRAAEKRRLSNECQRLRGQLDTARGSSRAEVLARTSDTCSVADSYRIVQ